MSADLYPVHLDVREKRVLVVGAGTIATRRVLPLVDAGARVVVVAPRASEQLRALAADGVIEWRPRRFDYSDVIGAWLVHTATDDAVVNAGDGDDVVAVPVVGGEDQFGG